MRIHCPFVSIQKNKHFGDERTEGGFRKRCNDERYRAEVVDSFQFCGQGSVTVSARDTVIRVPSNKLDDIW